MRRSCRPESSCAALLHKLRCVTSTGWEEIVYPESCCVAEPQASGGNFRVHSSVRFRRADLEEFALNPTFLRIATRGSSSSQEACRRLLEGSPRSVQFHGRG